MVKSTDRRQSGLSLKTQYGWMVVDLCRKKALQSLAECVREYVLVEDTRIYDEDTRTKFVKPGSLCEEFCATLSDYDRLPTRTKIFETRGYVLHEKEGVCES